MKRTRGFTLIELLTVIFIITVLVALLVPTVLKFISKARISSTQAQVSAICQAIESFKHDFGDYPASETDQWVIPGGYKRVSECSGNDALTGGSAMGYRLNGSDGSGLSVNGQLYPPRVDKVNMSGTAFLDAWGNPIEYFKAYIHPVNDTTPRTTINQIYPNLWARCPNLYIPAAEGDFMDPATAKPVNAQTYLVVSRGPTGNWGSGQEIGNWAEK